MKHETVQRVRHDGKTLLEEMLPGHLHGRRKKAGVIGFDGHFCAVIARVIKDPLLELHGYIWIFFKSGVESPARILWLWRWAVELFHGLFQFLL